LLGFTIGQVPSAQGAWVAFDAASPTAASLARAVAAGLGLDGSAPAAVRALAFSYQPIFNASLRRGRAASAAFLINSTRALFELGARAAAAAGALGTPTPSLTTPAGVAMAMAALSARAANRTRSVLAAIALDAGLVSALGGASAAELFVAVAEGAVYEPPGSPSPAPAAGAPPPDWFYGIVAVAAAAAVFAFVAAAVLTCPVGWRTRLAAAAAAAAAASASGSAPSARRWPWLVTRLPPTPPSPPKLAAKEEAGASARKVGAGVSIADAREVRAAADALGVGLAPRALARATPSSPRLSRAALLALAGPAAPTTRPEVASDADSDSAATVAPPPRAPPPPRALVPRGLDQLRAGKRGGAGVVPPRPF